MSELIYVNYLSKNRCDAEDMEREARYNLNRIATKRVLDEDYNASVNARKAIRHIAQNSWDWDHAPRTYTTFRIPKRSGGYREISAPTDNLKQRQKKLLKFIYESRWLPNNAAHGFTKMRNCKTSLQVHQKHKSRWFLKMDIHDFFGTTTWELVENAISENAFWCAIPKYTYSGIRNICFKEVNGVDVLPQGAPTSPVLCNLVMSSYDYKIQKYCHKKGLIYTRYADDILISSRVDFDWKEVQDFIQELLKPYTIAEAKTRYGNFNGRNWNLGIMYTNDYKLTVGHKRKHNLKCAVHNYCTKEELRTAEQFYKLQGQLAYCRYIEPDYEWFDWAMTELEQFRPTVETTPRTTPDITTENNETEEDEYLPFN